jgi:branched-chain amino acid transport system permease protein
MGGGGKGFDLIFYGAVIMIIALARPEGLLSLVARTKPAPP